MMHGAPPINQIFSPTKIVRLIRRVADSKLALRRQVFRQVDNAESSKEEFAYKSCFTEATSGILSILPKPICSII